MIPRRVQSAFVLAVISCSCSIAFSESPLVAAVWEHRDPITQQTGTAAMLRAVGFEVFGIEPFNFQRAFQSDVIVLGSFVSEHARYAGVMHTYATELQDWVSEGGVLLQLVQSAATEPAPPFLPEGLSAHRDDIGWNLLRSAEDCTTPLLEGLLSDHPDGRRFHLPGRPHGLASWQTFRQYSGWAVHLWSDPQIPRNDAALLEGQHGRGRIVLMAVPIDKLILENGSPSVEDPYPFAAVTFAADLLHYVRAVQAGTLPDVCPFDNAKIPPQPWTPGSWSLVVLPDTQYAAQRYPEVLESQMSWIVANQHPLNIRFATHEGDITHTGERRQWRRARKAFDKLLDRIPYSLTTGNHDYVRGSLLSDRRTRFADYFPADLARRQETFVDLLAEDRPENQAHGFSAGERRWLVVALEYLPSTAAVSWADGLLTAYRDHEVILVTHAFLDEFGQRISLDDDTEPTGRPPQTPSYHDGENLWLKLVSKHSNVRFVLSGHVTADGAGRRVDPVDGRPVHQMMANYQMRRNGGEGWLRILEFLPDGRTVQVHTYSPWLEQFMTGPQHQFTLDIGNPVARTSLVQQTESAGSRSVTQSTRGRTQEGKQPK